MNHNAYIDGPGGQLHVRVWGDGPECLICLAPSPYSGVAYNTLAPHLAASHRVIALDYPGYGLSTPAPRTPTIGDYADAALQVAQALSPDVPVTMLGFHTGTLVAIEAAVRRPECVKNVVLVDVPLFDEPKRSELLIKMGAPRQLTSEFSSLENDWNFSVAKRLEHVPLARGFEMFVDQISAGENTNAAFHAAFSYDCETRMAAMTRPALVIATQAGLHAQTLAAAALIPEAKLIEASDIEVAVLEKGAARVAEIALRWLAS